MLDTHCHLTFPDFQTPRFAGGVGAVLARAREQGVTGCITISTTTTDCLQALAIAEQFPNVWCSAGVHPLYADRAPHTWENLRTVASSPRCVAWGELGLDNHYSDPPASVQQQVLEEQLAHILRWRSEGLDKPVVLHCRKAYRDLIPRLVATGIAPDRFVFHCFTGGPDDVRLCLDFGAMVSFTGVVTYRNAPEVRDAARLVPLDRIMVETDAPFLSPDPHRGVRPCEPWMASLTARRLAEIRSEPWDVFHDAINRNTQRFFGIEVPPGEAA